MVLSLALVFSTYLPVSVYGTGTYILDRDFSWQHEISIFATYFSLPITPQHCINGFAYRYCLNVWTHNQQCAMPILLRHPFSQTDFGGTGILTSCPSPTTFVLSLGPD